MKKNQIRKSVAALAMAAVVSVSLLGYGCGSKSASSTAGVSGEFTGTAKGMGGDVTVTLTLTDGKITGCTAEGKDETPGIGTMALEQLPGAIAESGSIAVDGVSTATITSNAIKEAAAAAITAAGLKPEDFQTAVENNAEPAEDSTVDTDIVIVGAGCSGLAACVQAADGGAKVICLEAMSSAGGGAGGVEGLFAVGSSLQKEQGIEVSVGELVRTELVQNQYRNSSLVLKDLIRTSGEDIDWLAEHGVLFGTVDNYVGFHPIFHWFETLNGAESYIPQMHDAAEAGGVEFVFNTHADSLVIADDGSVAGVYATKDESSVLQVNAHS